MFLVYHKSCRLHKRSQTFVLRRLVYCHCACFVYVTDQAEVTTFPQQGHNEVFVVTVAADQRTCNLDFPAV